MSNFTAEEFRHTYQFYRLYHDFDEKIPVAIYEHEREVFRAYESFQSEYTWVDRSVANMLADRFGVYQGFEWVQASYAPLARVSLQVVKDERGHSNCGYVNLREVIELEGQSARRDAQRLINENYYPFFIASFGGDDSRNNRMWRRWGLKRHTNAQLRAAYHAEMSNVFESLGLETPDLASALALGLQKAEDARKKGRTQKVTS
jgi:ring-1,2-phenylacetyl-CoA epoxidase subunit PaaA